MLAGKEPAGATLDLIEAAESRGGAKLEDKVQEWKAGLDKDNPFAQYAIAKEGGDPLKGRQIYLTHAAGQCNKCHQVGGDGGIAGPDLTDIGKRHDRNYILESLLNPSAVVVPGYGITILTLEDGSSIGATLLDENEKELTLKMPDGKTETVPTSKVKERQPPMSAMPPIGLLMTKRELRDLVAYLAELKGKPFTGH